jgi:hypothetical protein
MRKIIIVLLAGIILLSLNSCAGEEQEASYTIKDALKISAYVFDENSGEDYFVLHEMGHYYYNEDDALYQLEQLKLNEVRLIPPVTGTEIKNMYLLNIFAEFDGIIEVISENEDVHLSRNNNLTPYYKDENQAGRTFGFSAKFVRQGFFAANPLADDDILTHVRKDPHSAGVWYIAGIPGQEYYLNVNVYKFDNEQTPVIKAQLKFVVLEDKVDVLSKCFSIELISYEYSDMYRLLDEIVDDENDE